MKALLYKDFLTVKRGLLLVTFLVAIIGAYSFIEKKLLVFPMVFVLLPMILIGMLFGNDRLNKMDAYLVPTPISRKIVVFSRYAFVWIIAGIGALVSIVLAFFAPEQMLSLPWHLIVSALLFLITVITAIQLPLMYRFDEDKARIVFVILYFLLFAFFSWAGPKIRPFALSERLHSIPIEWISGGLFLATLLCNALSFGISYRIYTRREF